MKRTPVAVAALLLLALAWSPPAAAQRPPPPGSYLATCGEAMTRGEELIATCRRPNGSAVRSALPFADRCVGDIANIRGVLECGYADGRRGVGRIVAGGPPPPAYAPVPVPGPAACAFGWHWIEPHWSARRGRWMPGECVPNR